MMDESPGSRSRRLPLVLAGAAGVIFLLAGGLFVLSRPGPAVVAPVAPVVEAPPAVVGEPPAEVSVSEAEADAQALIKGLSARLGELIGTPELLRKAVAAVQLASEGESWLHLFSALRPGAAFEVMEQDGRTFIDPRSYARYDEVTALIAGVDSAKAASAYAVLSPALEQLYREVARPGARFSEALAKALSPVVHAQISEAPVEVTPKGLVWAFKDADREGMDPTSKLLVRLGPSNARKVQAAARAFVAAAGL